MSKTAYYFHEIDAATHRWIDEYGCSKILFDKSKHEVKRPKLREALQLLKEGDELIISRFSNAVRGCFEFTALLEICKIKGIRLISVEDGFDTCNQLFRLSNAQAMCDIMGKLPSEIIELRRKVEVAKRHLKTAPKCKAKESKLHRNIQILNMYHAGHSLRGICDYAKIDKATVYRILKRNGVVYRNKVSGE